MSELDVNKPTREDVIEAWKPISAQGFDDPARIGVLSTGKPKTEQMLAAEKLYDIWYGNEKVQAITPEEKLKFQFDASMLYIDAGFSSSDYIDEVANNWLTQDAQSAEEQGFVALAAEINAKIDELNDRLDSN